MNQILTLALFTGAPGLPEILIVLAIILLLFGKRLPGVMRSLGTSIVEFKKGMNEPQDDDYSQEKMTDKEEKA
ncbi:MAG: twin-arginine translocase TatA/TatE family subunit [Planctomycetaceae bacterium]